MSEKKSKYYYDTERNKEIKESKIPYYYIGLEGMEARDVCEQFDLSYHLGSACSYILRSSRKHKDGGVEDLTKAIAHMQYEINRINRNKEKEDVKLYFKKMEGYKES